MEPKKLYTSLGTGFPPAGRKHGEGVEVGKRVKKYIVYTQDRYIYIYIYIYSRQIKY